MARYKLIKGLGPSEEKTPLDAHNKKRLEYKVKMYAKIATGTKETKSAFQMLFRPYKNPEGSVQYRGFSHEQILAAAATLAAAEKITVEQHEAYKKLFGTRG